MSYILGIDIGTGSTKAVALTEQANQVLLTEQVSYTTSQPQPHYVEQSPELIWQAFVQCFRQTTAKLNEPPKAIGLSSAMHSVIPVDSNGFPLMNMITWADGRSAEIADRVRNSNDAKQLYEATGTPIHAMSPLCKIIWLRENDPDIFQKTFKFISIKEFIWYKLFGTYEVDHSMASGEGLMDIIELQWYEPALKLAGISSHQLSTLISTSYCRNELTKEAQTLLQLSSVPVIAGAGDGVLANLGSNAITPGVASLTIGTSGAIRVGREKPCYNFKSMTFNYRLDEKTIICGGPVNNGGAALSWLLKDVLEIKIDDAHDYFEEIKPTAAIPPGSEGLIFLPYLMGERAPSWNSKATGVFFGITIRHKQSHFIKAVIEGICFALYSVGRAVEEASGDINHIIASGGFVKSEEWLQVLTDIFNKKIYRQNSEDASAIGAALIAIKAITKSASYLSFSQSNDAEVFTPNDENHIRYKKIFEQFSRLYDKLKDEMALVN